MQLSILIVFISLIVVLINWDKITHRKFVLPSLLIGLTGGILNCIAVSYLNQQQPSIINCLFTGVSMVIVLEAGLFLAEKSGLPLLWSKTRPKWLLSLIGVAGGVFLGYAIFKLTIYSIESTNTVPAFFEQIQSLANPKLVFTLLSVQAGITEEILFRIFLIPGAYFVFKELLPKYKKIALVFAIISSALLFGLIPTHDLVMGTIVGMLLGWAYLYLGLVPMIVMHAVCDLLHFSLVIEFLERL